MWPNKPHKLEIDDDLIEVNDDFWPSVNVVLVSWRTRIFEVLSCNQVHIVLISRMLIDKITFVPGRILRMRKQSGKHRILKVCKECACVSTVNAHLQNCQK